jgi:hypothetical protein
MTEEPLDNDVDTRISDGIAREMKENPQEWLANEQESNGITGIIFYRGRWCKSGCCGYLYIISSTHCILKKLLVCS